ncbi:argininosuccinate lyase isoform X1 [Dermacentor andersoni]|uniref:argininosuccinate lyase isoform X1 n=1 Tax=Dermacentor andersoni TaxID=34620 RepID=UPI00215530A7|nr:argininosuccinate lyase-like isoform X1 [Dermacentor andersoni]
METNKLWGGRFSGKTSEAMLKFTNSITYDQRLWKEDIEGSKAYAEALKHAGIITSQEADTLRRGLTEVRNEWSSGDFVVTRDDEDIHSANERRLKEIVGHEIGGKLHTGRSRNDQVATDLRLWTRKSVATLVEHIRRFIEITCTRAEREIDVLMPGYTHLQKAQPIRFSHWMLSYAWFLRQDADRFLDLSRRLNVCPLGSGALAGNPFPIDKEKMASELLFDGVIQNSLTAVSDRDFVAEFLFACSLTAVHLSKWAEDLILYSSAEFGYVALDDTYSTGSSLMPQKKNPDGLELIRGKTGRISGHLVGFLMVLKGLPSTYNKDIQEDKEAVFDAYDTLAASLEIAAGNVETMKVRKSACESALSPDMLATDVAYYLVRKGTPFRDAHHIAGKLVALAEQKNLPMTSLTCSDAKSVSELFDDDLAQLWNYEHSVEQYKAPGGTSRESVLAQIAALRQWLTEEQRR